MSVTSSSLPHTERSTLAEAMRFVRRSKSLASMLPALLGTGLSTLLLTALVRWLEMGFGHEFFGRWMETWLTAWPIAFPIAYLAGPMVAGFTERNPAGANRTPASLGLGLADIESASAAATAKNGLQVRRRRPLRTFEVA